MKLEGEVRKYIWLGISPIGEVVGGYGDDMKDCVQAGEDCVWFRVGRTPDDLKGD